MIVRRLVAGLLASAFASMPIAPPEHIHVANDHMVVHRHVEVHGIFERHAAPTVTVDEGDDPVLDDDDGPVLALTSVYALPTPPFVANAPTAVNAIIEPPSLRRFERPVVDIDRLIHGPPRAPTSSRAPPSLPAR